MLTKKMMKKIYFFIAMILCSAGVNAQIAAWDFTGAAAPVTFAATTFNANLVAGAGANNITRGATAAASAGGNSFRTVGFQNNGIATTNTDYFQTTLTANTGFALSLSTIDARFAGTASFAVSPGVSSQFAYSLDGTNFTLIGAPGVTIGTPATMTQIDLTGIPALQNVAAGTTVTIRYYASGQTTTGGWGFISSAPGINGLAFGGTVLPAGGGTPDIVLSSPDPSVPPGNIAQGSTNNVIYNFDLTVTTADAVLNGVTINTLGTYTAADITNFKCWYSADAVFNSGTDVVLSTLAPVAVAGPQVFPAFVNQLIANGATGYIFITADLPCTATLANDISVDAITTADISFVSGNESGTAFAGGLQTIIVATPNNVTAPAASVASASSNLTWVNPAGCYDEVLIVARAVLANDGVPVGDGTAYVPNLNFGTGTALGNGFVVYKGNASGQLVTNLVNGTEYFYKFFTRLGTTWSAGVEVSATPTLVTLATDYFRTVASGDWATQAIWESSNDSIAWIPATLIPGALASHVTIQSPDSVWLGVNRTTINLTLQSGSVMNALTFTMTVTNRYNLLGTASYYQGGTVTVVPGVERVLAVTSNYYYNGTQAGTSAAAYPEYGNLIWEPAASGSGTLQNNTATAPFFNGLVVRGDMTINIQGATPREVRFATGTGISRTHTIDGNLNIIGANSIAVVQNGGTGSTTSGIINIGGNLNISSGGIFQALSTTAGSGGNAIVNLTGNINNTGGIMRSGTSTVGFDTLNFIGVTPQNINSTGGTFTFTNRQTITINNSAGVILNTFITVLGKIDFVNGLFNTTALNLLTMGAGSTVAGASNASYVNGPLKKVGNTNFTFPIGKANGLVPIRISNFVGGTVTDEFTAEYIRANGNALGGITDGFIDHVSYCEYWDLDLDNGAPTVDITLFWNANNTCGGGAYITSLPELEVAHFDGLNWDASSTGFSAKNGTPFVGDITWPAVSVFSPFTFASITAGDNPLPITINYFNGAKQNGNHLLNWKVTCFNTPSATLELERSTDGRNYSSIYSIFATAVRCQQPFAHTDLAPAKGTNYYRLKMTDADGKVSYSSIVHLINAVKGMDILNIAPNPIVNGNFNVKISSAEKTQMEMLITDMQGRVLQKINASLIAGFNSIPVNVRSLAAGTYQLYGNTADGRTRVLRFVVQ